MKNPKKPTVAERKYLQSLNIDSNWFISKKANGKWLLIHKSNGQAKTVQAP